MESSSQIFPSLAGFNLGFFINKPLLLIFTLIFIFIYIIIAFVLFYHWSSYGMRSRGIIMAKNLFVSVSLFFLICMFVSLYYI